MSKNAVLPKKSARRFSFPEIKVSLKDALMYLAEGGLLFLFASVNEIGGALALGLFAGLIYARENMLLLAPLYILACVTFSLSWWTLLFAAVPVLLFGIMYAVYYRYKRNVPIYMGALCALVSLVPYFVVSALDGANPLALVLYATVTVISSFCSAIVAYAVVFRRINHNFTLDEQICAGIMLAVFSYALSAIGFDGFYFYFTVCAFIIVFCSDNFSPSVTLFAAILMGAGAALSFGDISLLGAAVIWAAVAVALSSFTRFSSALGLVAADALMWFLSAYALCGWKSVVMLSIGLVLYVVLPKKLRAGIKRVSSSSNKGAVLGMVNRNRSETAARLFSVSDVFYNMSKSIEAASENENRDYSASRLAADISKSYCARCSNREDCYAQLGGDTSPVLEPMAAAALARGKVTILDMPPFITGRCVKMHNLVSVVNSAGEAYRKRMEQSEGIEVGKKMMSEQFAGIALILDSLARECGEQVCFANEVTDSIYTELLRHNIVASDIVVTGQGEAAKVVLTVRECDATKAVIARIVSQRLKTKLETAQITRRGNMRVVHLEGTPAFEIAYGVAEKARDGEDVSGDSKSILCPSRRRRLFAISDGMGSGEAAAKASRDAVSMVEGFYRAGFDNSIILSLVNKLLKINEEDCFSSLDIAVVDTVSGGMDIIKMGAADSFIVRRDSIESLSCSAPPAGILDKIQPVTNRTQLYDGDMVILMSDGVFDALDTKGVVDIIEQLSTSNPQTLADSLLLRALENGAEDDCTVLALRLFSV
jgi:stage II sporulation protein E